MRLTTSHASEPYGSLHTLELTGAPARVRLSARRRYLAYWCVGVSWYGVATVRDLALHFGFFTVSLKWSVKGWAKP